MTDEFSEYDLDYSSAIVRQVKKVDKLLPNGYRSVTFQPLEYECQPGEDCIIVGLTQKAIDDLTATLNNDINLIPLPEIE